MRNLFWTTDAQTNRAIYKAPETLEKMDIQQNTPRAATIFSDSRIKMESVRNARNNNHLIEDITKMTSLEREDWNIDISWVKAHVGIVGNELAFFISEFEGFCTYITTRLYGAHYQTVGGRSSNLWASAHSLTTRQHGGNYPDDGSFFPVENRSFSKILYTYYTLAFTAT